MEIFSNPIANAFAVMSLFVAGLAIVLYYLKKFAEKQRTQNNEVDLRIVSRVPISQKSQVVIVETEGKRVMLGVTENSITRLSDLGEVNSTRDSQTNQESSGYTSEKAKEDSGASFGKQFRKNMAAQVKSASPRKFDT